MKKRIIIILLIVLDIVMVILSLNLGNNYIKNKNKLTEILKDREYDDLKKEYLIEINEYKEKLAKNYNIDAIDALELREIIREINDSYGGLLKKEEINKDKINSLKKQKETLSSKLDKLVWENEQKRVYLVKNVHTINQYTEGYPTGCESAALWVLLKHYGIDVNLDDIIDNLKKGEEPYYENGVRYGGNIYIEFAGHPSRYTSFGTYDKTIEELANMYKKGIINGSGMNFNKVLDKVREGIPVLVWNSADLVIPYISASWIYKPTGEKINWIRGEHALVVVGYDNNNVITSDTLTGTIRYFNKQVFENRYNAYGKRTLYYEE